MSSTEQYDGVSISVGALELDSNPLAGVFFYALAAQFMTVIMLAAAMVPGYDFSASAISDLGVAPETALLFNLSLIVAGLLNVAGGYFFYRSHGARWLVGLFTVAGLGIVVSVGATVAALPLFQSVGLLRSQVVALAFVVPLFAFLPAGYALAAGRRGLAVGTTAVGFAIAVAQQVPLLAPGSGTVVGTLIASVSAVTLVVCGVPLIVVGYGLEKTTVGRRLTSDA